ncbi:phosphatase PAP2 family protein [Rhodocaloribacter sp.]
MRARPRSSARLFGAAAWLLAGLVLVGGGDAHAQTADTLSTDARLFYAVYRFDGPVFGDYLRGVDATAYPVFFGAPAAAWAGAALFRGDGDYEDAYRLSLTWGLASAAAVGLKRLFRRPRPYAALPGVTPRGRPPSDPFSFPSGHTTLAFAMAASWSLSHPKWYVVAPAAVWAGSVAVSRMWLGVHYPGDVLAGALLGTGAAVLVHLVGPSITPGFLKGKQRRPPPMVVVLIRF